jgi:hypothetical protein
LRRCASATSPPSKTRRSSARANTIITLLDSSTPLGKQWRKYDVRADDAFAVSADQAPLSRVLAYAAAGVNASKRSIALPPVLVGRIVQKSNLIIYSSPDKPDKFPMYFTFNIADASATVKVVCWTSTCFRYFHSVNVGDVVALSNFRVQQNRAKPALTADAPDALVGTAARSELGVGRSASQLTNAEVEIVINPSNPEGRIRTLTANQCAELPVPPLLLNLLDTDALNGLAQFGEFDACGVVVFIGRLEIERTRITDEGTHSYRWLQLRDPASPVPLCVRWACNGRADVLDSFKVGEVVALTDLKLMSLAPGAVTGRHYAKATYFSQVMKPARLAPVAAVQTSVRDVLAWATAMGPLHWSGFAHRRPLHNSVFMRPPVDCSVERYMQVTGATLVPLRELDQRVRRSHAARAPLGDGAGSHWRAQDVAHGTHAGQRQRRQRRQARADLRRRGRRRRSEPHASDAPVDPRVGLLGSRRHRRRQGVRLHRICRLVRWPHGVRARDAAARWRTRPAIASE